MLRVMASPRHTIPVARGLAAATAVTAAAGLAWAVHPSPTPAAPRPRAAAVPLTRLVGQRLVVAISGTRAGPRMLARIRAGQVGGVILFASNIAGPRQLRRLTGTLQAAARAGGQPPLLIAVDQEGGSVKRITWAPPTLSPAEMAAAGRAAARSQGRATGTALRRLGVNLDLAPVMDVPTSTSSFIWAQGRAWSFSPRTTARVATAFAVGLGRGRVIAAAKHFPGLGRARVSTDLAVVTIRAPALRLASGLVPFRRAVRHGVPLVMLSTARYPEYASHAAAWSPRIISGVLRSRLGFAGATITDSLNAAASVRGVPVAGVALRSARAGADLLLLTGGPRRSAAVYRDLVAAARAGTLPRAQLARSYRRILRLKRRLA
jgi:beta-N-acetylhexosaminidase